MDGVSGGGPLRYTASHLWVRPDGEAAMVGLTPYGQEKHGRVFYVGLPALDAPVVFGLPFGYLQSAGYGLTQLFPPVQGEIVAINEALWMHPGLINEDPLGQGWLVAIAMSDPAELDELEDSAAYERIVAASGTVHGRLPAELATSAQPAFLIDERRRILTCNAAAERLIGLSAKEMQHGPLCSELFGCHLDAEGEQPVRKSTCPGICSMLNLEPIRDASYLVVNAQGRETRVMAEYRPIAEPGQPRRALVILTPEP
ncbi:MAG: PAS domain-containing protein [Armatimonadetes bacterium]|nr:PAS domain-containing protein [Armatimonadota bacterium]